MKALAATVLTLFIAVSAANAQNDQKFGYTNVDYILAFMPEAQAAQAEVADYEAQLQSNLQSKYQTLQTKIAEYEQGAATMIDAVRADKEAEIQQLQASFQQFQQQAPQRLQQKQAQVLQPLYTKVQEAINAVAEEHGYTYIFDAGSLLYAPEGDEISELVFKQLGVEVPAVGEGAEPGAAVPDATVPATGGGGQ